MMIQDVVKSDIQNVQINGAYEPFKSNHNDMKWEIERINKNLDRLFKSNYELYLITYEWVFGNILKKELTILHNKCVQNKNIESEEKAISILDDYGDEFEYLRKTLDGAWEVYSGINTKAQSIMENGHETVNSYIESLTSSKSTQPELMVEVFPVLEMSIKMQMLLKDLDSVQKAVIIAIRSVNDIEDKMVSEIIQQLKCNK